MARAAHRFEQSGLSGEAAAFLQDVIDGLSRPQKVLPCKYLYDKRGSELFEAICTLEEYYPTRTELAIMERHADAISAALGSGVLLIEYGSGSSLKTRILLSRLKGMAGYVPIDISGQHLTESAAQIETEFAGLRLYPVCGDYTQPLQLPREVLGETNRVVYFPGSTIGNFFPADAERFLARIAMLVGTGGRLLIGVDLRKDAKVLEAAYNDALGVTAEFNLNMLKRINSELDGDFDLAAFRHHAPYNEREGRIEMHLVSETEQKVTIGRRNQIKFRNGESIRTECSYKYTLPAFARLAAAAGLTVDEVYLDPDHLFSVQLLRVI